MYEVGPWFVHLMNLSILAIVVAAIMITIFVKKNKYQDEARTCIQAELLTSTGWSEYFTVKCGVNDDWVKIKGGDYKLDSNFKEWGNHPRLPFMGLRSLQVPIRKGTWYKDNPHQLHIVRPENPEMNVDGKVLQPLTASEIAAKTREAAAIAAGAEIVEIEARQRQLVDAIANQPNKIVVYIGLGIIAILSIVQVVNNLL